MNQSYRQQLLEQLHIDETLLLDVLGLSSKSDLSDEILNNIELLIQATIECQGESALLSRWLLTPAIALGNHPPITFVKSSDDMKLVFNLLGRIEHGVF